MTPLVLSMGKSEKAWLIIYLCILGFSAISIILLPEKYNSCKYFTKLSVASFPLLYDRFLYGDYSLFKV